MSRTEISLSAHTRMLTNDDAKSWFEYIYLKTQNFATNHIAVQPRTVLDLCNKVSRIIQEHEETVMNCQDKKKVQFNSNVIKKKN